MKFERNDVRPVVYKKDVGLYGICEEHLEYIFFLWSKISRKKGLS